MRIGLRSVLGSIAVGLVCLACGDSSSSTPPENKVKISDDRTALKRHIAVPDGLDTVRWAARARGKSGIGPTDLELLAWFPLSDAQWAERVATLGPEAEEQPLTVPSALLDAVGLAGPAAGNLIPCTPYETSQWRCVGARRRSDGLLVYLVSR